MPDTTTMTFRLDKNLKDRLGKLAESTKRSKSFLASEAIKEFVDLNEWQIRAIEAGIRAADEGRFASDEEMEAIFTKHEK